MKGIISSILLWLYVSRGSVAQQASDNGGGGKRCQDLLRVLGNSAMVQDLNQIAATMKEFYARLAPMTQRIESQLELPEEERIALEEQLKKVNIQEADHARHDGDSIEEINRNACILRHLFQSDVVLTKSEADEIVLEIVNSDESRSKRQAFRNKQYPKTVWRNDRVAFFFDKKTSERVKTVFRKGAKLWRDNTCIDIFEDTCGLSPDRIRVVMEDKCWSNVGREGGEQKLSLGDGCDTVYTAAHELGHSLGFYHTHERHDRNQFIRVNRRNIDPEHLADFRRKPEAINYNYGLPLDFGSIMLYESTAFSRNRKPTMVPRDINYIYTLGSPFLSFYDIQMLNLHYNCTDRCKPTSSAKCENGGFPHPRDCTRCICPGGYGGRLCNERPSGCGKELEAKSILQTFKDTLGKAGLKARDDYEMCHYWIKAPLGKKIEVKLLSFSPDFVAVSGCKYNGVEIKTQADQCLTGYRFCSTQAINTVLVSKSNIVPIITYNSFFQSSIEIQYRSL